MHKILIIVMIVVLTNLSGCRTAPVYNPSFAYQKIDFSKVEDVIKRNLEKCKWQYKIIKPGNIEANLHIRTHYATINISYSDNEYKIKNIGSIALLYKIDSEGREYIHENYNVWVGYLVNEINTDLGIKPSLEYPLRVLSDNDYTPIYPKNKQEDLIKIVEDVPKPKPKQKLYFDALNYKKGSNTVTGQAFLRQNGGGVVTCAGATVIMTPNTPYFTYDSFSYEKVASLEAPGLIKTGQCDAQGNFEIDDVPDGEWIISTDVTWMVPNVKSIYSNLDDQGGPVKKAITVKTGSKNKFLLTR